MDPPRAPGVNESTRAVDAGGNRMVNGTTHEVVNGTTPGLVNGATTHEPVNGTTTSELVNGIIRGVVTETVNRTANASVNVTTVGSHTSDDEHVERPRAPSPPPIPLGFTRRRPIGIRPRADTTRSMPSPTLSYRLSDGVVSERIRVTDGHAISTTTPNPASNSHSQHATPESVPSTAGRAANPPTASTSPHRNTGTTRTSGDNRTASGRSSPGPRPTNVSITANTVHYYDLPVFSSYPRRPHAAARAMNMDGQQSNPGPSDSNGPDISSTGPANISIHHNYSHPSTAAPPTVAHQYYYVIPNHNGMQTYNGMQSQIYNGTTYYHPYHWA